MLPLLNDFFQQEPGRKRRIHTCPFENCAFTNVGNRYKLTRHINTVHLKLEKHICLACGSKYGRKDTLRHHQKFHCASTKWRWRGDHPALYWFYFVAVSFLFLRETSWLLSVWFEWPVRIEIGRELEPKYRNTLVGSKLVMSSKDELDFLLLTETVNSSFDQEQVVWLSVHTVTTVLKAQRTSSGTLTTFTWRWRSISVRYAVDSSGGVTIWRHIPNAALRRLIPFTATFEF